MIIQFRLTCQKGMLTIDGKNLYYGNIKDMYETGNGHGLQCDFEKGTPQFDAIEEMCAEVSKAVYKCEQELLAK